MDTTERMTEIEEALRGLTLEAIHYRNTGKGVQYLNDAITRAVAVSATVPGCGRQTHVVGSNDGTMPCGALLTMFGKTKPYLCAACATARDMVTA